MIRKVLVVDDEKEDLLVMKEILENKKYSVRTAMSGKDALSILRDEKFNLILLDILMPGLSGYELLKLIRQKYNHRTPLVYISIVPGPEVDMTNADGFIQKPFSPETFINGVNLAFNKKKRCK